MSKEKEIPDGSHRHGTATDRLKTPPQFFWWLAINGASCAASFVAHAMASVSVSPTPEQLLGFRTQAEQLAAQKRLLNDPPEELLQYVIELGKQVRRGQIMLMRPDNPEPPAEITCWNVTPA